MLRTRPSCTRPSCMCSTRPPQDGDTHQPNYYYYQSVQNAGARLVTGTRRSDHITPVLRQLHWLPVCQRVAFKIAGLVHQSLAGADPTPYLADDCHLLSNAGRRPLRSHSNDIRKLTVPRTVKHTTNLATGVSRLPVLDCGMTFHPGFGGRDSPSILLDDL